MAINNYIRPMLEVYQQLEVTVQRTQDRMAACIVGANYDLYRYGYEDLKPITPDGLLADGSQVIPLEYYQDPSYEYEVDPSSLKLYAEGLLAKYATLDSKLVVDPVDPFVLRTKYDTTKSVMPVLAWIGDTIPTGYSAIVALTNSNKAGEIEVGDTVLVSTEASQDWSDTEAEIRSGIVMDLVGVPVAASVMDPVVPSNITVDTTGATLTTSPQADTTFQIAVTAVNTDSTVTYQVTDSAGLYTAKVGTVATGSKTSITLGDTGYTVGVTFASGVTKGKAATIGIKAATVSTKLFNGIRLSTTPVALADWNTYKATAIPSLAACKAMTGWLEGEHATVDADGTEATWENKPTLSVRGVDVNFIPKIGKLYQQFRVMLKPGVTDDVYTIKNVEDIQKYFGTIAVENDLAYGCASALEGSAGRAIYALRVRDNTADAYLEALNKVETNSATYSFAILNEDMDVLMVAKEYVEKRSHPENKKWCRALCGIDMPGDYTLADMDLQGNPINADIVPSPQNSTYLLELTTKTQFDFLDITLAGLTTNINPGDKVVLLSTGAEYTIARVSSSRVLVLEDGPTGGVSAAAIKLVKADTPVNAGEYVAAIAEKLNNRRFTVVYCDRGTVGVEDADGDMRQMIVPNRFLAATVAGIASAVVPQAPITRTEITTIDAATRMYTQYTQLMLDNIAKHGVLLVTQDVKNQPCYIRHQLTTETDKGSLYYEESCTRNLDNISYSVVDVLEGYIGKSNVTPSALRSIMNSVTDVLTSFTQDSPNDLIGPSLINWTDLTVEQDPVFKDRVIVRVKLYLPLPLNNIKMYEMAYAAEVTI